MNMALNLLSPALVRTITRLIPLLSSTCSLWFSHDQWFFLSILAKCTPSAYVNHILPPYFGEFLERGLFRVGGWLLASIFSTAVILVMSSEDDGNLQRCGSYRWYLAGAGFAASHLAFAPFIIPHIRSIIRDSKDKNAHHLHKWLRIHVARSLTSDVAAWICFLVAVAKTFTPEM